AYMKERSAPEIDAAYERFFAERLDAIRVNPEAAGVLRALRAAGVRTAVATNTNRPLADRILRSTGLAPLLDAVACANEAGAGKPDPAVVRLAAARVRVPLAECLFVGDSKYDAEAARRALVAFRGYRLGAASRIESLEEILAIRIDSPPE
ncbi:MAG TPA: HAD family hydrolase, partial [Thermoanaerobaculia bacterium]